MLTDVNVKNSFKNEQLELNQIRRVDGQVCATGPETATLNFFDGRYTIDHRTYYLIYTKPQHF